MNDTTALATVQPRQAFVVDHVQPLLDTPRFEQMQRAAKALMCTTLLNETVRGSSPETCFSNLLVIFDYADRWKVPAVMLAQCVSIVHGKLMWEGKAISAALESTLGVTLHYHWTGERGALDYRVYVWDQDFGTMGDDALAALAPGKYPRGVRMIDGAVDEWRTFQKDGRSPNPAWSGRATQNQLAYRGAREWARLYAAATMLGVYGDDEFQAVEDRGMVNVTQPDAPRITTGFTRPAETAQDAPGAGSAGDGPQTTGDAAAQASASQGAAGEAKAQQETPRQAKAREKAEAQERETQERLDAMEAAAADGMLDGRNGTARRAYPEGTSQEVLQSYENGWLMGDAARLEEEPDQEEESTGDAMLDAIAEVEPELVAQVLEDHGEDEEDEDGREEHLGTIFDRFEKIGADGGEPTIPEGFKADETEAAMQGWNAGAAVRASQGGDDDAGGLDEAAEDDAGGGALSSAFDIFAAQVKTKADWAAIRTAYNELARTDDWKAELKVAGAPLVRVARITTWMRVLEVAKTHPDRGVDPAQDVTAYRCFLEAEDNADVILKAWQGISETEAFKAATPDAREKLQSVSMRRMQELRGS